MSGSGKIWRIALKWKLQLFLTLFRSGLVFQMRHATPKCFMTHEVHIMTGALQTHLRMKTGYYLMLDLLHTAVLLTMHHSTQCFQEVGARLKN